MWLPTKERVLLALDPGPGRDPPSWTAFFSAGLFGEVDGASTINCTGQSTLTLWLSPLPSDRVLCWELAAWLVRSPLSSTILPLSQMFGFLPKSLFEKKKRA